PGGDPATGSHSGLTLDAPPPGSAGTTTMHAESYAAGTGHAPPVMEHIPGSVDYSSGQQISDGNETDPNHPAANNPPAGPDGNPPDWLDQQSSSDNGESGTSVGGFNDGIETEFIFSDTTIPDGAPIDDTEVASDAITDTATAVDEEAVTEVSPTRQF